MTLILPGADIHAFYQDLGITLPQCPGSDVSVRCFADREAHRREDRHPSMSVNLITGAYNCHGCGASGGAYDAALAAGHSPRSAIELMIQDGLLERRARITTARELIASSAPRPPRSSSECRPRLGARNDDINRWQNALANRPLLIVRLARERGWSYGTMRALELGWDRGRITIPIRDHKRQLIGVLRYQPFGAERRKMVAVPGTALGLIPHPVTEHSRRIVLVEGPPDMIAARSIGIPAIAVPGDHAWRDHWAGLLAGRDTTILMDADHAGRAAAHRIHDALTAVTRATILDLAPSRSDGYDLTDWLNDNPTGALQEA